MTHVFVQNFQNIVDGKGIELTIAGMVIVFTALSLISICIWIVPKVLALFGTVMPKTPIVQVESEIDDKQEVAAVIAMALSMRTRAG